MTLNYEQLLAIQKQHAVDLLNSLHLNGVAFDSSQTGCGKTYVAAWIAKNFNVSGGGYLSQGGEKDVGYSVECIRHQSTSCN